MTMRNFPDGVSAGCRNGAVNRSVRFGSCADFHFRAALQLARRVNNDTGSFCKATEDFRIGSIGVAYRNATPFSPSLRDNKARPAIGITEQGRHGNNQPVCAFPNSNIGDEAVAMAEILPRRRIIQVHDDIHALLFNAEGGNLGEAGRLYTPYPARQRRASPVREHNRISRLHTHSLLGKKVGDTFQ